MLPRSNPESSLHYKYPPLAYVCQKGHVWINAAVWCPRLPVPLKLDGEAAVGAIGRIPVSFVGTFLQNS